MFEKLSDRLGGNPRLLLQQSMRRGNGNGNGLGMEALDLVQTLFRDKFVLATLQVEQRDSHLKNFLRGIAVQCGAGPRSEDAGADGAFSALDNKFQALRCARPEDKISERKVGWTKSKKETACQ